MDRITTIPEADCTLEIKIENFVSVLQLTQGNNVVELDSSQIKALAKYLFDYYTENR